MDTYNILHNEILRQGEEGLEFNFRLFENLSSASFINRPLYHYVYCDTSITAVSTLKNNDYVIKCYEAIKREILGGQNANSLLPWFYNRMMQVVVTSIISGIFNPSLEMKYKDRKKEFNDFLEIGIVDETLKSKAYYDLSTGRRCVLFLIKRRQILVLYLLGIIRRYQKTHL